MSPVEKEKTRMSIAGRFSNRYRLKSVVKSSDGFTLIEIMVVILLIGFMISITVPAVRETLLTDNLKTASRKIIATINAVKNKAVSDYKDYNLVFDINSGKYWYECEGMNQTELMEAKKDAVNMPDDVHILDIHVKDSEKKSTGEVTVGFSKKGYNKFTLIHIGANDGRKFTFVLRPFLGKVELMKNYVDFEDISSQ